MTLERLPLVPCRLRTTLKRLRTALDRPPIVLRRAPLVPFPEFYLEIP